MLISSGTVVLVQVGDGQTTLNLNPNDVVTAVSAELSAQAMPVLSQNISGGLLARITPLIQESFEVDLQIHPQHDTDTDTLTAMVQQAFFDVTQKVSTLVTIPSIGGVSTGEPQANKGAATNIANSIADAIAAAFAKLTSTATTLLIGAAAIVVLILVLLAYGPNVGHIAAAVA